MKSSGGTIGKTSDDRNNVESPQASLPRTITAPDVAPAIRLMDDEFELPIGIQSDGKIHSNKSTPVNSTTKLTVSPKHGSRLPRNSVIDGGVTHEEYLTMFPP